MATAESLTGGQLAAPFTAVPGASACFVGGVVAYASAVKVSRARRLAEHHRGVRRRVGRVRRGDGARGRAPLLGSTYALATTGVAGPDSQEGHPAGHVWVACAGPEGVETMLLSLAGDRAAVQSASCRGALSVLDGMLRREDSGLG